MTDSSLYLRINKLPRFLKRLYENVSCYEFMEILRSVPLSNALEAINERSLKRCYAVKLNDGCKTENINDYLDTILKHRKKHCSGDIYQWEFNGYSCCGNYRQFLGLCEEYFKGLFEQHYSADFKNKSVLDIGGFVGDSALYFLSKGARQVIIYEPLKINTKAIFCNFKNQNAAYSVYQEAISSKDDTFWISSEEPEGTLGFGMTKGRHKTKCQGVSFKTLLSRHEVDLIKVDCEGGELYLLDVDDKLIRKIPYWMVETHSKDLYAKICLKFIEAGYRKLKDISVAPGVDLIHFEKVS